MTFRAVLLGLMGASFVCGVTYVNDWVIRQTQFVGNVMPISVYGFLIAFVLLVNPLLYRIAKRLSFSGREITLVLVMTLSVCCIPGSGLMRYFTGCTVLPHHLVKTQPAWKARQVLERLPPNALVKVTPANEDRVLNGFVQGLGSTKQHLSLREVPWKEWLPALAFWVPLILLFWFALTGLSAVMHRQWADHEHLPYPIAQFADSLLPGKEGPWAEVFRNRMFWFGMAGVMLVHFNNFAYVWYPNDLIQIPLFIDFQSLKTVFPNLVREAGTWWTLRPTFFLTAVGFAFFLASDVSFGLGIGPLLCAWVSGMLVGYGISVSGPAPNITNSFSFGAFCGMMLVLLYTGRRYYTQVLRSSLCLPAADRPAPEAVWGGRLFLASIVTFIAYLVLLGRLEWPFAVLFAAIAVIVFVVLARIVAETGCFFIQVSGYPAAVLLGLFGAVAIGPQAVLLMSMFTVVLMADVREALTPFLVNNFKMLDLRGIPLGRVLPMTLLVLVLGLAVAIPVTLYFQYDRGANMNDSWSSVSCPSSPFAETVQVEQRLEAQDQLPNAESLRGLEHFAAMHMDRTAVISMAVGLGLVILFTIGRLRFSKWPVHPVMFLVWNTYAGRILGWSFLLGWLIKILVTKFGGGSAYKTMKPLMIGLIAGEVTAGLVIMIINGVYYWMTGQPPNSFRIMPG